MGVGTSFPRQLLRYAGRLRSLPRKHRVPDGGMGVGTSAKRHIELSSSGKTQDFDSCIRKFESCQLCQTWKSVRVWKWRRTVNPLAQPTQVQILSLPPKVTTRLNSGVEYVAVRIRIKLDKRNLHNTVPSTNRSGHHPFKVAMPGSNPAGITNVARHLLGHDRFFSVNFLAN